MEIIIGSLVLFYLIGCVLSFGLTGAHWYEEDERNIPWGLPEMLTNRKTEFIYNTLISWWGVLMDVAFYGFKRKYWLKFSYKKLIEKRVAYLLSGEHELPKHETFEIRHERIKKEIVEHNIILTPKGWGTVVHVYPDKDACEVEIKNELYTFKLSDL
jgi:hypothetical protein